MANTHVKNCYRCINGLQTQSGHAWCGLVFKSVENGCDADFLLGLPGLYITDVTKPATITSKVSKPNKKAVVKPPLRKENKHTTTPNQNRLF